MLKIYFEYILSFFFFFFFSYSVFSFKEILYISRWLPDNPCKIYYYIVWKTLKFFAVHFEEKKKPWNGKKELTVEFEPPIAQSEIVELPADPRGSWRLQLMEKTVFASGDIVPSFCAVGVHSSPRELLKGLKLAQVCCCTGTA